MKKYGSLFPPLVERIMQEERFSKNPDKTAKTRLHQIYGAYVRPNSNKKAAALLEKFISSSLSMPTAQNFDIPDHKENDSVYEYICNMLTLHSSTNERLPYYNDFYDFIFGHTGAVKTIMDLGCGFNPFSLLFFPQLPTEYHAIDIDLHTKDLLNSFFEVMRLPKNATCEDLAAINPILDVDLTLMLKLFPTLEANAPGRAYSLANELNTTWLVVTFPTKSLGGRKKGMEAYYRTSFLDEIGKNALSNFELKAETVIGNELVFILTKKP